MDKSYEPQSFETRWYSQWEASGCFKPSGSGTPYTILLPPPNVTGTLHMGHAFQHTLMDSLIRYHRMRGYDTLWQMGTDHAGIATEMVVARNIGRDGLKRDELGREKFVEKVWEWKRESGDTIARQMRRLGASGDWSREVFTMDAMPSKSVIEAFVKLHEQGLIYRGQRLVNWDPVLKTAISDLEVVSEEEDGFLWSILYPFTDESLRGPNGERGVIVATTRPETMLGDVAVMVHPEDERYAHLIGKTVTLPLTGRTIPIIADDYVDREFGTGVVKVTPAHDKNDYAVWQRHVGSGVFDALPNRGLINIFTPSAHILHAPEPAFVETSRGLAENRSQPIGDTQTDYAQSSLEAIRSIHRLGDTLAIIPSRFRGLDRFEARKAIVSDLEELRLLVETKKHKLQVPRGDRSGEIIEDYLTYQWFVKMDTLAKRGLELVENGSVKFVPPNWISTYRHWMENIQDWCISRQLWWGHRIPAWYDDAGNCYVGRDEETAYLAALKSVRPELVEGWTDATSAVRGSTGSPRTAKAIAEEAGIRLHQDQDVLETWFSSALWPFSTMGWPDESAMDARGFDRYVPSSVLVTGFDIIFFWVARMIFMTDHFTGRVPFREVYITGLVRDAHGQKMSKSKGNVLDPIDLIDGIGLEDLVAKRTTGLMKPTDAPKIEKATRKEYPDGIPAFGADALRFTFASLATHGRDIKFDLNRCEGYKNFCNKLWNAARFVLMNCEGFTASGAPQPSSDPEHWILNKLHHALLNVESHYAEYRFDLVASELYEFTWNNYCDWFVEFAKPVLQSGGAVADAMRHTMLFTLEALLRALHPLIPFVTEEIWQHVAAKLGLTESSISVRPYPEASSVDGDAATAARVEILKGVVIQLRSIRSQMNIPPSKQVPLLIEGPAGDSVLQQVCGQETSLKFLARLESVAAIREGAAPASAMAPYFNLKLHIPLAGLIDLDAERTRLAKEIARVSDEISRSENKLAKFGDKAPAAVVEQERTRLADWSAQRDALHAQAQRLAGV